jgi:hypothetical protein
VSFAAVHIASPPGAGKMRLAVALASARLAR